MARFLNSIASGATARGAGAAAGWSEQVAQLAAEHYARLGVLEQRDAGCSACPATNPDAPTRPGCAGCFFAPRR